MSSIHDAHDGAQSYDNLFYRLDFRILKFEDVDDYHSRRHPEKDEQIEPEIESFLRLFHGLNSFLFVMFLLWSILRRGLLPHSSMHGSSQQENHSPKTL